MKILLLIFDTKFKRDMRNCVKFLKSYLKIVHADFQVSLISENEYYKIHTKVYDLIWYYQDTLGSFEK